MLLYFLTSLPSQKLWGHCAPLQTIRQDQIIDVIPPSYLASISPVVDDFDFFLIDVGRKKNLSTHPHTLAHPVGPESPDNRGSGRSQPYCHKTRDCHK